eukprot:g6617.t1
MPQRGETLAAKKESGYMLPGGKGANQAVAAARLCSSTAPRTQLACVFGADAHATTLRGVLEAEALDLSHTAMSEHPSGQAFIFLEPDGANSIAIVGGANQDWSAQTAKQGFAGAGGLSLAPALRDAVQGAAAVLLQREIPDAVNVAVARAAADAGVPVIMDMGGDDAPLPSALLPLLDMLCPNETELARVAGAGFDTSTLEGCVEAARAVQARCGVRQLLVTLGELGSFFLGAGGEVTVGEAQAAKAVDTTGAGDCFRAAFSVALCEGRAVAACLRFAACAAALCVARKGAIPSMPHRRELQL